MALRFAAGDPVHTAFGKGVVREIRGARWVLVEVGERALVLEEATLRPIDHKDAKRRGRKKRTTVPDDSAAVAPRQTRTVEIDLHGFTVEEALARTEAAVNDALLTDAAELRVIHGQSGGRIRHALHAWLRRVPSVRAFNLDPRNPGVTILRF